MTNAQILMQREHDAAMRQRAFDVMEGFDSEVDVMVKVHDFRINSRSSCSNWAGKARIPIGKFEPIEVAGGINVVAIGERLAKYRAEASAFCAAIAADEIGVAIFALGQMSEIIGERQSRPPPLVICGWLCEATTILSGLCSAVSLTFRSVLGRPVAASIGADDIGRAHGAAAPSCRAIRAPHRF